MAHEINKTDKFGEVRANGKRAWHGLGIELPEGMTAQEGFERIGLGWRTILAPVHATVDVMGADGPSTKVVELPKHRMHLRADTMEQLGMVSDEYKPFENQDLARFADALVGADATVQMETGGSLYSGKRVFALVKLPKSIEVAKGDILNQYILVGNGHGGFAAFSCYPTSVRVVCANTLRWSETDISKGLKFRHTGDTADKLKQARYTLGLAMKETERFEAQVKALAAKNLTAAQMVAFMKSCFEENFGKVDEESKDETQVRFKEKRDETVGAWLANLENERQQIKGIRGTAWAAYNAISEWHDHERSHFRDIGQSDARVHSNLFGVSQKAKLKSFKNALSLV